MHTVKIRSSLKAGWHALKRRPWYLMGLVLSFVTLFIFAVGNAAVTALSYIVYGGYISVMLNHFRGNTITFDDMFSIDMRWISFAFLGLLKTILIMLGFICFIIPGIYLSIRWMFAEILVIDKGMRPMEALEASGKMVEGHYWKLLLFMLTMMILLIISLFALIVGVIPMSIVAFFATVAIYENLKGVLDQPVVESSPEVSAEPIAIAAQ